MAESPYSVYNGNALQRRVQELERRIDDKLRSASNLIQDGRSITLDLDHVKMSEEEMSALTALYVLAGWSDVEFTYLVLLTVPKTRVKLTCTAVSRLQTHSATQPPERK